MPRSTVFTFLKNFRLFIVKFGLLAVSSSVSAADLPAPSRSLLIAPNINGADFCPEAATDITITAPGQAEEYCRRIGSNAAPAIKAALDALGPVKSPSGDYELGYTLSLPLLSFYTKSPDGWHLDKKALATVLSTIADVDRPVVVYLSENHFGEAAVELKKQLAQDTRNLMWTSKGPLIPDNYFMVPVYAWTLTDQGAPINVMRREAFKAALAGICALPEAARKKVAAVSVLGEVHQLYPNFLSGMGFSSGFEITDYSPNSVEGFRKWLHAKYTDIDVLNQEIAGHFDSFETIQPPARTAFGTNATGPFGHLDSFAAGTLPVYGWAYDTRGDALVIKAYIDDALVGESPADFNRTDVPEVDPTVKTPNVGWRINIDYRGLTPGWHILDLSAETADGRSWTFGRRQFRIADPANPDATPPKFDDATHDNLGQQSIIRAYIDGPVPDSSLLYNPLAKLWLEYRNKVVRDYYEVFALLARQSCIPHDHIFSHQITPQLNPVWNSDLMAVDASQQPDPYYLPGTTLYGGRHSATHFSAGKRLWAGGPTASPNFIQTSN